jgi:hypothetical protein
MQGAADFHNAIANARLPEAAGVVDDAATLDAAVDVLNAHAAAGDTPIRRFLHPCESPASRRPGRHDDLHLIERKRQEAQVLEQAAAWGQGIRRGIGHSLIVRAAGIRLTQKADCERGVDQQDVFDRVACFLAAITARLLTRVLGALDAPFAAIMAKRGEAGAGASGSAGVGGSGVGTTTAAASASVSPRRFASSAKDRVGASPSARSVACSTAKRT